MTLRCGIVGLPNVGKSTLFNALTQTMQAEAANYPFCTIDANIGRVSVPDERLDRLAKIANSQEIIRSQIDFVDIFFIKIHSKNMLIQDRLFSPPDMSAKRCSRSARPR